MMRVFETGEATWEEDKLLMMERAGYLEEAYFSYSFTPVFDATGKVGGIFTPVIETTSRVLSERRLKSLGRLAACVPDAKTTLEVGFTRQTVFPLFDTTVLWFPTTGKQIDHRCAERQ